MEKLDHRLREALDATGLPWEVKNGGRHTKVMLDGRLVAVLSRNKHCSHEQRLLHKKLKAVKQMADKIKGER